MNIRILLLSLLFFLFVESVMAQEAEWQTNRTDRCCVDMSSRYTIIAMDDGYLFVMEPSLGVILNTELSMVDVDRIYVRVTVDVSDKIINKKLNINRVEVMYPSQPGLEKLHAAYTADVQKVFSDVNIRLIDYLRGSEYTHGQMTLNFYAIRE